MSCFGKDFVLAFKEQTTLMFIQLEELKVNVVDGALEQTRRKTYLQIYKKP